MTIWQRSRTKHFEEFAKSLLPYTCILLRCVCPLIILVLDIVLYEVDGIPTGMELWSAAPSSRAGPCPPALPEQPPHSGREHLHQLPRRPHLLPRDGKVTL